MLVVSIALREKRNASGKTEASYKRQSGLSCGVFGAGGGFLSVGTARVARLSGIGTGGIDDCDWFPAVESEVSERKNSRNK